MRILITGTEGYIGSLLAPLVVRAGHEVVGFDTGYFTDAELGPPPEQPYRTIRRDIRDVRREDLEGIDAILHLAGLSNDALGQLSRRLTYQINHLATMRLAKLAREAGVSRFVYASSCSVYGKSAQDLVDETSQVDPQTDYALFKVADECELAELAGDDFSPTFLRNATAYGASPRMRFDLVVNGLAALAWTTHRIAMTSDGTPWRPIVHVLDISRAMMAALEAPREVVHNQVFNVGDDAENFQVRDIAACIGSVFPGCEVSFGAADADQRSYRVAFGKIRGALPGFQCEWTLRRGAEQLHALYAQVGLTEAHLRAKPFTRLHQLRHLVDTGRLDADFYWTRP